MKTFCFVFSLLLSTFSYAQEISKRLDAAIKKLQADDQFKHAIISMYVVDSKTGKPVFDVNSQLGLAPASCQKVVTSVSAFEMLGKNYTYKTSISFDGLLVDSEILGDLYFYASGDPTLGSWRWAETNEDNIKKRIGEAMKKKGISSITGNLVIDDLTWETQATPNGWVWEDIGNYYGAGARGFNWHENQYDLNLKPGKKAGDPVQIIDTKPSLQAVDLINELKTGTEGSGDQSVIYLPEGGTTGYVRGTVPAGRATFTVSGSLPNPESDFFNVMRSVFSENNIGFTGKFHRALTRDKGRENVTSPLVNDFFMLESPPLDSINYWFLKKSVNLYGEALVKTIACKDELIWFGATDSGLNVIKNFWEQRGIERSALKIIDGSGLSPANRVTTLALVTVMQYAKNQSWFPSFYYALPETNGIKMKDGYISGVRSYTGYVKSKTGAEYTFSFIVNNFDGSAGTVREKMWKLLDVLK